MPAVILHRIDHKQNMHRYYRLDVQPDLLRIPTKAATYSNLIAATIPI
jgi:predicted DNA-binding WGR domain protein